VDNKELEALNMLHYSPVDENRGVLSFVLITLREKLISWHHTARSLTSSLQAGCLIVVGDQAYHCCVVGKLNDDV
jgi:hypothetical protein